MGPQGPPVPGLVVKDAHGALVGVAVPPNQVAITNNGATVLLTVGTDGFEGEETTASFEVLYASADCTGQPLQQLPAGAPLFSTGFIFQGVLYYGTGPVTACIHSIKEFPLSAADCVNFSIQTPPAIHGVVLPDGGCCIPNQFCAPQPWLGLGTVDLTTFVPPFQVSSTP
jgi:hypothetical protein